MTFMFLVSDSSTFILETLGEIALLSALCMFFKASGKIRALKYQFPFNWRFILLSFSSYLIIVPVSMLKYHIIMQCYKSFKNEYTKQEMPTERLDSALRIQVSISFHGIIVVTHCMVFTIKFLSRHFVK